MSAVLAMKRNCSASCLRTSAFFVQLKKNIYMLVRLTKYVRSINFPQLRRLPIDISDNKGVKSLKGEVSFDKNDEIRPSISFQIILELQEERNQLNS